MTPSLAGRATAAAAASLLLLSGTVAPRSAASPADNNGSCPVTAAQTQGWGEASQTDGFDDTSSLDSWQVYDAEGHAGNGRRTPNAVAVADGALTITGNPNGDSGGMAWRPDQTYGRWEVCMKSSPASPNYHSVALLWPQSNVWPDDGEIDFMEILDPARQVVTSTVIRYDWHDPELARLNFHEELPIDATEWHSWAVEWTPDYVAGYVDGQRWFETTDNIPRTPMHLCIQLDNFGGDISAGGQLSVDWARTYPLI